MSMTPGGEGGNILVTGASGQLGSELRALEHAFPQFRFHFFDRAALPLDRPELLKKAFEDLRPKVCINAGAYTAVDKAESEKELAFAVNGKAVGELASLSKKCGSLLIHVSTDYVFDGNGKEPYRETETVHPLGVYGASKLEGEQLAMEYADRAVVVRTSWVYSSYGKNFVKTMLRLQAEKESIGVVNDQVGRPTYAADLAAALLGIAAAYMKITEAERKADPRFHRIYHYADQGAISWFELAKTIAELTKSKCVVRPITTAEFPTPAKRPAYSVLDTTRIEQSFGLSVPGWKDSLGHCLERIAAQK